MSKVGEIIQGMQNGDLPSDYWTTLDVEFPELEDSKFTINRNGQSVWEHTMSVIDLVIPKNPITLLSGLFHDLGKCYIVPMNDPSLSRFPGHPDMSANIAEVRLTQWGTTPQRIDKVVRLITMHMYDINNSARKKTIRKFIANVGPQNVNDWFTLRIADSQSYAAPQQYCSHFIEQFRVAVMLYLKQQPGTNQPPLESPSTLGGMQIKGGEAS